MKSLVKVITNGGEINTEMSFKDVIQAKNRAESWI